MFFGLHFVLSNRPCVANLFFAPLLVILLINLNFFSCKQNFEAILEGYLSEGTEEMRRQIEFLIKQINSNEVQEEVDSDIEDGDEDEEVNSFNIFGSYDKRN